MTVRPTLWQIPVSHYSEKARWALAWKQIEHVRRSPPPGSHMVIALWLTRGAHYTFPVLTLDGRHIGDSTAIIAALEERRPEPALYPADPADRRRALELEDFFDEEVGPHTRLLVWHELRNDRRRFREVVEQTAPAPLQRAAGLTTSYAGLFTKLRFGAGDPEAAELARAKIVAAFDRLDAELEENGSGYLVGEEFTVADLTAASLLYPIVLPEEGPISMGFGPPAGLDAFREPLRERPGYGWVEEMFRRHRRTPPAAVATA
jgi:glutathione S-transferase